MVLLQKRDEKEVKLNILNLIICLFKIRAHGRQNIAPFVMNILLQVLLAMFSSDDIELDFDDDFSCNIFCKREPTGKGNALSRGRVGDSVSPSGKTMTGGLSQSPSGESNPNDRTSSSGSLNTAPRGTPKENTLKRPLLQDEKPQKKRLSHETLLPRKFPGPAGLLPDKPFKHISDFPLPLEQSWDDQQSSPDKEKCILFSQSSGSVFLESAYQKLVTDFSLNDSSNPLNKYTLEWVKRTALSKGLQGRKIPFLGLVVHAVNHSMPDPVLILRDPTGEISGSLHREVWAEMGAKLRAGIALALRQVGVLITGVIRRQIYLNITMNNILAVYRPCESEREVEITRVNKVSQRELVKNVGEWSAPGRPAPNVARSPCAPLPLTSIEGANRNSKNREEVLSDLGIVLRDGDFSEEMRIPESEGGQRGAVLGAGASRQALSPAESLIFEEVLSGIDLEEFDL